MGYILPETGDGRVQNLIVPVSPLYESSIPDWGSESFSFQSYGFMPTEQPYISMALEKVTTVTLPGVHGSLIQPVFLDATNTHKNWEARTGSLDFYYIPNGKNHILWDHDLYAHSVYYSGNDSRTDENHDHPWCFFGQYHKMLHFLQGRRAETLYPWRRGRLWALSGWIHGCAPRHPDVVQQGETGSFRKNDGDSFLRYPARITVL